jgi:hypothetical protein
MRKELAIGFLIVALALSVGFVSANGNGNQTPTPVDGSPVGTVTQPTPIWPTATASPEETAIPEEGFVDDGVVVKDLPTTGVGSTAPKIHQRNHTGWHPWAMDCSSSGKEWRQDVFMIYSYVTGYHYFQYKGSWYMTGGYCWFL